MSREAIFTAGAPKPGAPYAQAIKANGFLFVTGQVSRDPASGDFMPGTFEQQLHQAIKNLRAILEAGGSSLDKTVKLTIYMTSQGDLDVMNRVLGEYFP